MLAAGESKRRKPQRAEKGTNFGHGLLSSLTEGLDQRHHLQTEIVAGLEYLADLGVGVVVRGGGQNQLPFEWELHNRGKGTKNGCKSEVKFISLLLTMSSYSMRTPVAPLSAAILRTLRM